MRPLRSGIKLVASSHSHDLSLDAQPTLDIPLHLVVSRASAQAIAAVEAAGGSVTTRYYTKWALQRICEEKMHPVLSLRSREVVEGRVAPPGCGPATQQILAEALKRAQGRLEGSTAVARVGAVREVPVKGDEGAAVAEEVEESEGEDAQEPEPLPPHVPRTVREYRYRLPDPTRRDDIEYYRDPAHRGYLSFTVRTHESPSLFFRPPVKRNWSRASKAKRAEKAKKETKLQQIKLF